MFLCICVMKTSHILFCCYLIFYHRVILLISVIPYTSEICVFVHQKYFSLELYSMMHICECETNRTHSKWILCDYAHINSPFEQIIFLFSTEKKTLFFLYLFRCFVKFRSKDQNVLRLNFKLHFE